MTTLCIDRLIQSEQTPIYPSIFCKIVLQNAYIAKYNVILAFNETNFFNSIKKTF